MLCYDMLPPPAHPPLPPPLAEGNGFGDDAIGFCFVFGLKSFQSIQTMHCTAVG